LLSDPKGGDVMGSRGRERAMEFFSVEKFSEATLSAYARYVKTSVAS
jgi:hypothetical protein